MQLKPYTKPIKHHSGNSENQTKFWNFEEQITKLLILSFINEEKNQPLSFEKDQYEQIQYTENFG